MSNYNEPMRSDSSNTNVLMGIVLVIVVIVAIILFAIGGDNSQAGDITPTATMSEMLETPMPEMEASLEVDAMATEPEATATAGG